jgi:hypothetical protein
MSYYCFQVPEDFKSELKRTASVLGLQELQSLCDAASMSSTMKLEANGVETIVDQATLDHDYLESRNSIAC